MQRVLLTIKGTQREGDTNELIELITEGRLKKDPQGFLIEYDESILTGTDGCTTSLLINDDSVTLQRSGEDGMQMIISPGRVYKRDLSTPSGMMSLYIYALRVESKLSENEGSLLFEYELNMGSLSSINTIDLSFKRMKDCVN